MYANRIRELRQSRAVSATEIAFRAGCSITTLWRYERGEAQPPLAVARAIARVLDATVDEVFPPEAVAAT